jgi:hypothetical protein
MQLGYIKRKRERLMTKHYRILDEYFMCFNGFPWSEGAIMCGMMNLFYFQYVKQTWNALRFLGLNHQVGLDFIAWVWDRNWLCQWNVCESSRSFASFFISLRKSFVGFQITPKKVQTWTKECELAIECKIALGISTSKRSNPVKNERLW